MSVDEGGVARFQCQVNGVPEASITWERDRTLLSTSDNRYTHKPLSDKTPATMPALLVDTEPNT